MPRESITCMKTPARTNPNPLQKTQSEGLPWLKGRWGKQEVVEFHIPFGMCNPRLSKLKKQDSNTSGHHDPLVKTKSSNRNSNYNTQPARMCSLHEPRQRERERVRLCFGLYMCFALMHDVEIEVASFLQANSGSTKRVTRQICAAALLYDAMSRCWRQFSAKRPFGSILIHLGHVSW